jgi:LysM repeat protein
VGWVNTRYLKVVSLKRNKPKKTVTKKRAKNTYYAVQAGDTLFRVMRKTGVSWKTIAGLNNIQAPYDLRVGRKLILR